MASNSIPTRKFMTNSVVTIGKDEPVLSAYKLMIERKIRHLPVIDQEENVVGMLSDRDVQRAMVVDRTNGIDSEEIYLNSSKIVSEFMSPKAFTALPDTPLSAIIEEMMEQKISAVIIVNDALKCEGIVTSNDIMRVFLDQMARNRQIFDQPMSFFFSNTLY
jgi:CBS domain-containing protein